MRRNLMLWGVWLFVGLLLTPRVGAIQIKDGVIERRCYQAYVMVDGENPYPSGIYCTSFMVSRGYFAPEGNDANYWDNVLAGKWAFVYNAKKRIPDDPGNNEPAVCTDDEMVRWLHATKDVNAENLRRIQSLKGPLRIGTLVLVTYDDGGSEVWIVHAQHTQSPLGMTPMGGTKKCP